MKISQSYRSWHHEALKPVVGLTFQQQLEKADLDWEVKTSDIRFGEYFEHCTDKASVAYRADTGEYIDTYINRVPWQNRQILGKFHDFCEAADLKISHLGRLGWDVVAASELPYEYSFNGKDPSKFWLLLRDSHVRGKGLIISCFAERLICANGLRLQLKIGRKVISHVGTLNENVIHDTLAQQIDMIKTKEKLDKALAERPLSPHEAHLLLINQFGIAGQPIHEQPREVQMVLNLYKGSASGAHLSTSFNTAYGLLQAVTEYYNWHQKGSLGARGFSSVLAGARDAKMNKFQSTLAQACGIAL